MLPYLNPFNNPTLKGTVVDIKTEAGNDFILYLPPGYDNNNDNNNDATTSTSTDDQNVTKFPILYHLHGLFAVRFITRKDLVWTAYQNELYAKMPMIIVAPLDPILYSMWADGTKSNTATIVLEDIMPYIEKRYHNVDTNKQYIQGFSMGGFGAITYALKFPTKFQKVIVIDGAMHDWTTLCNSRSFIAQKQFNNQQELFDLWSPFIFISNAVTNGTIQQTPPILIFTGSFDIATHGERFVTNYLQENNANYQHIKTEFSHCSKYFLDEYGQKAFEFLAAEEEDIFD